MTNVFAVLLGHEEGSVLAAALRLLNSIPVDDLKKGIDDLERETAVGPLRDPSAWTDGERGARAIYLQRILRSVIEVREHCERLKRWEGERRPSSEEPESGRNS